MPTSLEHHSQVHGSPGCAVLVLTLASHLSAGTVEINAGSLVDPNYKNPKARYTMWATALLFLGHGLVPCHEGLTVGAASGLSKQKASWYYT